MGHQDLLFGLDFSQGLLEENLANPNPCDLGGPASQRDLLEVNAKNSMPAKIRQDQPSSNRSSQKPLEKQSDADE